MDDIYVTVENEQLIGASVAGEELIQVNAVGIQGISAATSNLGDINDVDLTILANGSLLIYDTTNLKWKSSIFLEQQDITGGQY
jgi:hypothetical protein